MRVEYTTNAIESQNTSLRKVTKNRGHFPCDETMFESDPFRWLCNIGIFCKEYLV